MSTYSKQSLVDIEKNLSQVSPGVILDGKNLSIRDILTVARSNTDISLTTDTKILNRIKECYEHMMEDMRNGVPIYGCNTGYGARASRVVNHGTSEERIELARAISESIQHIDVSTGPVFEKDVTRGAMLIRINMLMQGVSGVKLADLQLYTDMLNAGITPIVNQYGGIGASGDLAHNCRVLSAARHLPGTKVWDKDGNTKEAKDALSAASIQPLLLDPKVGLGMVNGDNFSTALATLLAFDTLEIFLLSSVVGAMMIEVLQGSNRSFHSMLSDVRPHTGQKEIAAVYRYLLDGSKLAFQEMTEHKVRPEGVKVQDAYSLRCIQQYQAGNVDRLKQIFDTITINANSVSDNPLWVAPEYTVVGESPWHWVSGGNFLAMHMAEAMDQLRKIITQVVKLNDRHLGRLVNPNENNGLPANVSGKDAISQCTFKGVQIQSGMFDVYSTILSIPVTTMFGVHEEMNQDITSHALTSGILGLENLRLARYSTAQNLLAVAQAVDLRGGPEKLSDHTRPLYEFVRGKADYTEKEKPLHNEIESLYESIKNGEIMDVVRTKVFHELQ